eukprot:scaffold80084_cov37-Tisochrysis_lutea.AAC.3
MVDWSQTAGCVIAWCAPANIMLRYAPITICSPLRATTSRPQVCTQHRHWQPKRLDSQASRFLLPGTGAMHREDGPTCA